MTETEIASILADHVSSDYEGQRAMRELATSIERGSSNGTGDVRAFARELALQLRFTAERVF